MLLRSKGVEMDDVLREQSVDHHEPSISRLVTRASV